MIKGNDVPQEKATFSGPDLDRREFTVQAVLAMLAGVSITISGCGGGGGGTPTQPNPPSGGSGDKVGNISANHGHQAVITSAQLTAAAAIMLDIRGSAPHNHTVPLSASEVSAIAAGQRVSKASSDDDQHTHVVTFN